MADEQGIVWDDPPISESKNSTSTALLSQDEGIKWDNAPEEQGITWDTEPSNLTLAPESAQLLQGTPVAPGMPTSVQGMGSPNPTRGIVGLAEAVPAIATGLPGFIVGTPAKLGSAALNAIQGIDKPFATAIKQTDEFLAPFIYQPKTAEGAQATKGLTYGMIAATAPYLLPLMGVSEALDTETAKQYLTEEQIARLKVANDALMLVAPIAKQVVGTKLSRSETAARKAIEDSQTREPVPATAAERTTEPPAPVEGQKLAPTQEIGVAEKSQLTVGRAEIEAMGAIPPTEAAVRVGEKVDQIVKDRTALEGESDAMRAELEQNYGEQKRAEEKQLVDAYDAALEKLPQGHTTEQARALPESQAWNAHPRDIVEWYNQKVKSGEPLTEMKPPEAQGVKPQGEGLDLGLKGDVLRAPDSKESTLAVRAEADAIAKKLTEDFGELPEYKTMSMKDQAERAQKVMEADYEQAKRMAMGEEVPPSGIREATMYEAVKLRALKEGDVDTLRSLATESTVPGKLSEYGQAIKAADSGIMDDPVKAMQDVAKARADRAERTGSLVSTKVQELNQRLKEANDKLSVYENAASKRHAGKAVFEIQKEIRRESRKESRSASKAVLDEEFGLLSKELGKIFNPNKLNVGIDPAAIPVLLKMAKNRIRSGIITVEALVESIYQQVKSFTDTTKREVRDAISGYGKTAQLSKDEINVRLRELNRQARLISALEDAKAKQMPLRSGLQRDAVSNEVRDLQKEVKQAMRESGIDSEITRTPEAQFKSALDAVKTRLRNQIRDITKQLETGEKTPKKIGITYDKEANALKVERDKLRSMLQEIEGKPEMSSEQRVKIATDAVEKSIKELERRISEKDLAPSAKESKTPITPELSRLRSMRDALKVQFKAMQDAAKAPKDPEAIRLKTFKTRTANEIEKLNKKLADGDFTKPGERQATTLDTEGKRLKSERDRVKEDYQNAVKSGVSKEEASEIVRLSKITAEKRAALEQGGERLDYGAARVAYENYVNDLKGENAPIKSMLKDRAAEFKTTWKDNRAKAVWVLTKDTIKIITDNSIAMVASLDNSFLGRQGLKTLMTHPSAWWPGAKNSFIDFAKTIGGKNAHDALNADVYSRPNYLNGEYQRAKIITRTEEQYPTTLPERVPVLGRVFKASEVAFTGSGLRMRTDLYDLFSKRAKENGIDINNKAQAESLGKMINSLTARGQWGTKGEHTVVRLVLWAPRMLKGNIDVLTAHNFGAGLESAFARKEAAKNLLKIVAETATVMAIANALSPGSAELDPRSSDFGKIKVGDTRFDITGGAASIVTLASRIVTRASKSSTTGLVMPYGLGYGKRSPFDALIDFLVNKTTPPANVVASWLRGRNYKGDPFTVGESAYRAFTPISLQNFINLKDDASADRVAGAIVDIIGISASSYGDERDRRSDIVSRIREKKQLTDSQRETFKNFTPQQKESIRKDSKMTVTRAAISHLSAKDAMDAWENMGSDDKGTYHRTIKEKVMNSKTLKPREIKEYLTTLKER